MTNLLPERDRSVVTAILLLFVLAVATGALFRFAGAFGTTLGFDPVNVRHAHSHLMYFGWVTPPLMLLIGRRLTPALPTRVVWSTMAASLLAYISFLLWGYESATIGEASVPLSVIAASANMVVWYFFAAWYRRARISNSDRSASLFWDIAVAFMLLASAGAWTIALTVPLGIATPTVKAVLAHAFLDWFAGGWIVFGLLGAAFHGRHLGVPRPAVWVAVGGTLFGFLLGLPSFQISDSLAVVARMGGLASGAGFLVISYVWWKHARADSPWVWSIWLLALVSAGRVGALLLPGVWWADVLPMRILYVHSLVLGFATVGLAGALMPKRVFQAFLVSVLLVLLSLLPVTELWPWPVNALVALRAMAWIAPLPAVVALFAALVLSRPYRPRP